jgi:hypothetical protein
VKKLILRPRDWPKALGAAFDSVFSGGVPFTPMALPPPFSPGAIREYEGMRAQQDFAYRASLVGQAGIMGGLGGQLLNQLMGYRPYETKPKSILEEGKVSVQVTFKRIDKEHVLVQVDCIQRIVHNKKELREVVTKLLEEYAEQYVFGEQPKSPRDMSGAMSMKDPEAKELPGGDKEVSEK